MGSAASETTPPIVLSVWPTLQLRFLRGISLRQRLIERAVMDQNGGLDFGHVLRPGRAAVERCRGGQFVAQLDGQGIGHAAAKAEARRADFPVAISTRFQPPRGGNEILEPL